MVANKHDTLMFEGYQRMYKEELIKKNVAGGDQPVDANSTTLNTTNNTGLGGRKLQATSTLP